MLAGFDRSVHGPVRSQEDNNWTVKLTVDLMEKAACLRKVLSVLSKHIDYMESERPDILTYLVLDLSLAASAQDQNTLVILESFVSQEAANRMHHEDEQFAELKRDLEPFVRRIEGSGYKDVSALVGL